MDTSAYMQTIIVIAEGKAKTKLPVHIPLNTFIQ